MPLLSPPYPAELPPALELFSKDPSLFRQIKETFRYSEEDRFSWRAVAVILGVVAPLGVLYCITFAAKSMAPTLWEKVIWGVVGLFSMLFGRITWRSMDEQWEFSGEEIRRVYGRWVYWCVPIETITMVAVFCYEGLRGSTYRLEIVTADHRRYELPKIPALYQAIIEVADCAGEGGMGRQCGKRQK